MTLKFIISKNKRFALLFILLGVFSLTNMFAQTSDSHLLKGTVIDGALNEPIIGASVVIKGTSQGTMTDLDGNFQLQVPAKATISVSYIGYNTKEVALNGEKQVSISLSEDTKMLDEVVVIGYGQVKKGDVTGSLTTIKPDELNKGSQLTIQDAMVGKMAGLSVVPGSGAPGDGGTIRIRMGASLSASNDPLVVIDGVPITGGSFSDVNPNDIETFTVLKDASATAIYGSRASNGVILITTKKGSGDIGKVRLNYSSSYSISHVRKYQDVLSATEFRDIFQDLSGAPNSFQLGNADTDWQRQIFRTAFGTDHNLSATGSTYNMPYRISVGYTNQDGIIKKNNYERMNLGVGFSPKFFNDHLSFDINVKGSIENRKPIDSGVAMTAATFDPTRPVHQRMKPAPDETGLGYFMWINQGTPIVLAASNPVANLELTDKKEKTKRSIGNIATNYKIHGLEDLILSANLGYDVSEVKYDESTPDFAPSMYTSNKNDGRGRVYNSKHEYANYLIDLYANYTKGFLPEHTISAMGGYGWQRFWNKLNDSTYDHQGNQLDDSKYDEEELYLLSFFGRLNYSYANKLLVTATLRTDASSRFAKGNRWGYFPSVAVAYRLTGESFLQDFRSLSDLKLRASYGQTGQQDVGSYYQHLGTYTSSYEASRYKFGDRWYTMIRPNGYDPNIKWETTSTYNFGLDYGFLNNRISGSIDVYTRETKDLLNEIFVPAGSNFTNLLATNIGNMKSKGVELSFNAIPVKTKDWEWSIGANFTWNSSKISKLNTIDTDDNYIKTGAAGGTGNHVQIHKVGETPNTFFLLKQAYDDNGQPLDGKYIAPDGTITTEETDANKYNTGKSSRAPYYYGLSSRVNYKNWDLGINAHGSFGNYIYNYPAAVGSLNDLYSGIGTSGNILRSTLDNKFAQTRRFSDIYLEKGDFFKLDNITLGYSFSKLWDSKSSLRLAFNIQNVFTITNYSGIDPEVFSGIDRDTYQRPRIYSLSLNLNF